MSILTRYLLRAHVGPFFFAFTALTGLLFLNAVAQRLEELVGKGLSWDVVLEFFALSLPHTVALTLPMAVLVAVLYTFSDMTANNEITAMSAGGVKPARILLPMVMAGGVLTLGMLYFNDRVLPEANHQLKNLLVDVGNKSPTFELEEQVLNEIRTDEGGGRYYLRTARIDRDSNELFDVVIYDVSGGTGHRTTYAERGTMAFNEAGTDLYLTLHDGIVLEAERNRPEGFRRLRFDTQVVPLRGVGDLLERRTGGDQRSDREMTIAMLAESARQREEERARLVEEVREESVRAVERALGVERSGPDGSDVSGDSAAEGDTADADGERTDRRLADASPSASLPPSAGPDGFTRSTSTEVRTRAARAETLRLAANRYRVEIHKKYTIAFACLVFVLIGAPIAVRFPRGGVGMTIAVSVAIFGIYWMGLIGGEKLADKGVVNPAVAMWTPNVIFFAVGLFMSFRMGRWIATARGGGWSDLAVTLERLLKTPLRRLRGGAEA